jgi:hypothetical protein
MEQNFIELMIDNKLHIMNINNISSVKQISAYVTELTFFNKENSGYLKCKVPMNYGELRQLWFIDRLITYVAINTTK